jgi:uncharacterized protein (DUF1501 family)
MQQFNRRKFLQLGCRTIAAAGLASAASTRLSHAADDGYRALVCINLEGGNDGFNMLVPRSGAAYQEYANDRGHLAIRADDLIALNPISANTTPAGLHPSMAALRPLFNQGHLGFLANVGTMVEPVTVEEVRNKSATLPQQLFSHHDQARQWQQLDHINDAYSGWGARATDLLASQQANPNLTAISLAGRNDWLNGGEQSPFNVSAKGINSYSGMDKMDSNWQEPRRKAFIELLHQRYNHMFAQEYADLQSRTLVLSANIGAALNKLGDLQTPVPENNKLAAQLAMVAKLIAIKDEFRMTRQLYYVSLKGFDTHDGQLHRQPELFSQLSSALAFFHDALGEIGQINNVTSFTTSDFGRTVTSNGDGTDHGWGNHHIMMGGAVAGADIYGTLPRVTVDGPDDSRNGRIVPTIAASQYAATSLRWLGVNETELDELLPTLRNFSQRDLGFMG